MATALAKDPTQKDNAPFDVARAQRRVDYLKRVRPNDPQIKKLQAGIKKAGPVAAPAPTGPVPFADMTRAQQVEQGFEAGGQAYGNITNRFQNFDPYQMQAQYQPGFTQEMDKARQNIMGQFDRRNQEEFQRQQEDTQRQIVERGLDPASPAAQALYKQMNVRQDLARQEAMSAAETAAYGVQQQGYDQSYKTAMAPYEQFQAIQAPYVAGIGAQYTQEQGAQNQQYAKELAALENKYKLQQMRAMPRGGGGAQQPDYFEQYMMQQMADRYAPQQQQPSALQSGMQSFLQGAGAATVSNINR